MSAASDKQYEALRQSAWLRDLRVKGAVIFKALSDVGVKVDGTLLFDVNEVPVSVKVVSGDAFVRAGVADDGKALYEWRSPLTWMTEAPPA